MMIFQLKITIIVLRVNAYNDGRDVSKELCIVSYNDDRTEHWRHSRSTWSYRMIAATELTQLCSKQRRTKILQERLCSTLLIRFQKSCDLLLIISCKCHASSNLSRIFCNVSSRTNRLLAAGSAFLLFIQLTAAWNELTNCSTMYLTLP